MPSKIPTLVIVDMQECMADPAAGARNNPDAEDNIAALLAAWRDAGASVVHVRHMSRDPQSGFWPGRPGAAFQHRFLPRAGEHVIEKNVPDAFANSALERWLHLRGVKALVFAGVSTNISVESTVRSAGNLGFITQVPSDATFAFAKTDYAGTPRSADEVHAMSLSNLHGEYATVTTTAALIGQLAP